MGKILQAESTLTDRYQTTIPEPIREVMHLGKRDKINYEVGKDGQVLITRAEKEDPVIGEFLLFLAIDMQANPSHIHAISSNLRDRAQALTSNMEIDLNEPLADEDE
jgi:antitoxin PrlF